MLSAGVTSYLLLFSLMLRWSPFQQRLLMTMVALGRSNREVARELFLSEATVKAHISHIMTKLGLERRTELVRHALAAGLLTPSDDESESARASLHNGN